LSVMEKHRLSGLERLILNDRNCHGHGMTVLYWHNFEAEFRWNQE
jgi:hypothetical protein